MPTTNPVPSQDPSDLLFNAGKLDEVLNGTGTSFTDRLGTARRTVVGMNADFDAQLADAESDLNVYRADAAASAAQALGYLNTIRTTSYGAYASDPATDPLGNPPTVGDEYFNTTANLLKRWNGTTWQASDINTENLAAPSGSSLIGYDTGTVQDVLDGAVYLADYAELRSYTGRAKRIYITGLLVTKKPSGIAGTFQYDPTDTTTPDTNGTVIVDALGRRWKRDYSGPINVFWFGAKAERHTFDDTPAIQAAINAAKRDIQGVPQTSGQVAVYLPAHGSQNGYSVSNLTIPTGCILIGDGSHRTIMYQRPGSSGDMITNSGTSAMKIQIRGITVYGDATSTGNGIKLLGDEADNPWGAEGVLDDVYARGFVAGVGIWVHANVSIMHYVRAVGCQTGFIIDGVKAFCTHLVTSNNTTNYIFLGEGHRVRNIYSETPIADHIIFGNGTKVTTRNEIDGVVFRQGQYDAHSGIWVKAVGSNTQINVLKNCSLEFYTGTIANLILDESNGVTLAPQEVTGTHGGIFEYNHDLRGYYVKYISDSEYDGSSNYSMGAFRPFTTYIQGSDVTSLRFVTLPNAARSYGRTYVFKNRSAYQMRIQPTEGTAIINVPGSSTPTNLVLIPPYGSAVLVCDQGGAWNLYSHSAFVGSKTYDPPSLADGASTTTTISLVGAALGDFVEAVSFSNDMQGVDMSAWVSASSVVTVRLSNRTGGVVDLASGTLKVKVSKY